MPEFDSARAYFEYLNGGAVTDWQEIQDWAHDLLSVRSDEDFPPQTADGEDTRFGSL